jgi:ubiquinone/menaquinone biosynthesis C-methylase UbiE
MLLLLAAMLTACLPPEPVLPELTAEQQRLRAEGKALYDRVGWTYQHRNAAALALQLTQRHSDPDRVMALLPVEEGDVVADIGAGVGWFTFRLARAAGPQGRVLALDIQPEAVALIEARARDAGINPHGNVEPRLTVVDDCQLGPASVDLAFMAHLGFYLHPELMDENVAMLASVARAVKPDGHLAVLEYIPPGLTEEHLVPHFEAAGFALLGSEYFDRHQTWLYTFVKAGEETQEPEVLEDQR